MGLKSQKRGSTKSTRVCKKRTICEVHRQIYDLLVTGLVGRPMERHELLEAVEPLLEEAFDMGVQLVKKLVEYKMTLPAWEKNLDRDKVRELRALREALNSKLR